MVTTIMASPGGDQPKSYEALELYTALASIPVITSGMICSDEISSRIEVEYSIRDHVRLLKRRASQAFQTVLAPKPDASVSQILNANLSVLRGPLSEVSSEVIWKDYSPTGQKHVILREFDANHFIEVWDTTTNQLKTCHDVTERHGKFIANETFGFPVWNSQETCLAYVAESTFKPANQSPAHKYRYIADFGEQLSEIRLPTLFLLRMVDDDFSKGAQPADRTEVVQVTSPLSASDVVYGQPVFGPASSIESDFYQVFCTGFSSLLDGRRPGLIYCQNRPTAIYELNIKIAESTKPLTVDSMHTKTRLPASVGSRRLSSLTLSARSPRVLGDRVYYICNPLGGPHGSCAALHFVSTVTWEEQVLVPVVEGHNCDDVKFVADSFPGLYVDQLPARPFLSNPATGNDFLVTTSIWGSLKVPLLVNLHSGNVQRCEGPSLGSCTVWNTNGVDLILASYSQTTQPAVIWLGTLAQKDKFTWTKIEKLRSRPLIEQQLSQTSTQIIGLPINEHGPTEIVFTSAISHELEKHSANSVHPHPVIIAPHGGPHSCSVNEFSPVTAAFALLGYSTAYINYPGSLGFGQMWVYHLIKHLGMADVESSKLALDYLKSQKLVHPHRAFVSGGSHGGFITAHLTSRYPDLFLAACMRNPVVDLIGTATGGSDIPDWSFAEAGLPFPMKEEARAPVMIDEEAFRVLKSASPISQLDHVKTPTLLLLGDADRRVSHQQGLAHVDISGLNLTMLTIPLVLTQSWYHGLKGRGIKCEAYMFPGNSHPLSGIKAELASFEAIFEHFSA